MPTLAPLCHDILIGESRSGNGRTLKMIPTDTKGLHSGLSTANSVFDVAAAIKELYHAYLVSRFVETRLSCMWCSLSIGGEIVR